MALPAIGAFAGRVVAWTGLSAGLSRAWPAIRSRLSGVIPAIRNALPKNVATALGIGGGAVGGFGVSEIFDRLGIENSQLQTLSIVAVIGVVLIGVGQILDIEVSP